MTTLLAVLVLCGCGGHAEPPVTEAPTTAGAGSMQTANNAIAQDLMAVRTAFDSGQADDALMGLYDLVQGADEPEGAETIRKELPGLVTQLNAAAPAVLASLSALELQTNGGRRLRDVVMKLLCAHGRLFNDLNEDFATGEPTPEALGRWEEKNNTLSDRLGSKIEALVNSLPPEQRVAVRQAVYAFFTR